MELLISHVGREDRECPFCTKCEFSDTRIHSYMMLQSPTKEKLLHGFHYMSNSKPECAFKFSLDTSAL